MLVGFLDGDIDRPVIVGALYNGQGDAGIASSAQQKAVQAGMKLLKVDIGRDTFT